MAFIPPSGLLETRSKAVPPVVCNDVTSTANARYRTKGHVALKVLTADSYGRQHDTFELDILGHIKSQTPSPHLGSGHILGLSDKFVHHGPHGNHLCLVFKAMGPEMSKYRRLFPKQRI